MRSSYYVSICVLLFGLSVAGCGPTTHAKFVPSIATAREALEEALKAWKDGKPCKAIEGAEPVVQPVESRWQQGLKLAEFEILKELEGDSPKRFLVKVKLEGSPAAEEATYVVLGKDPLYVYFLADYEQSSKTM